MNKELLLRVKAHILEEPRRLNMSNWMDRVEIGAEIAHIYESGSVHIMRQDEVPPCGTVGCIAGWAAVLDGVPMDDIGGWAGREALGLNEFEGGELFYPGYWPNRDDYYEYKGCGNAQQRAQVVARVIDAFIAKYEEAK